MDENDKHAKKPWQKPELIVLVRSNPEEAVLAACKYTDTPAGPQYCKTTGSPCVVSDSLPS